MSSHFQFAMILRASVSSVKAPWRLPMRRTRNSVATATTSNWKTCGSAGTRRSVGAPANE